MVEDVRLTCYGIRNGGSGFDEHYRFVVGDGIEYSLSTMFGVGTILLSVVFQNL